MDAAENLAILGKLHPRSRCHTLTGNLKGKWTVDLEHPRRLLFEPANDPVPILEDGGLDLEKVTAVRILKVSDTHG